MTSQLTNGGPTTDCQMSCFTSIIVILTGNVLIRCSLSWVPQVRIFLPTFFWFSEPQFLSFLDDESKTALLAALGHYGNIAGNYTDSGIWQTPDATIILEDIYKRNKKFTKPQFCAYVAHTVQRRNLPGTEQYFDMVLKFNPTSEQISCIFSKSLQLIVSGLLHYAGKIQSLEQTVKLWLRLKNQSSVPKYYLDTLRAVIDCKKRVFDAKQLHVRLEQALRSKPQKQAVAESMKEVIEFMNTLASRIEYGWQNWDE